jgi:tripartite-type tricarboxylate transporter receptor subunit TctC
MDETGVKGYEATLWFALMTPPGLPPAIAARLRHETSEVLKSPEMKESLAQQGFVADPGTPDALMAKIRSDIAKWHDVIGKAGIKPE